MQQVMTVRGGAALQGTVHIAGAKNAALPLMATTLLTDQKLILHNVPDNFDVKSLSGLLRQHGTHISTDNVSLDEVPALILQTSNIASYVAPHHLVRTMRASILVLGPLLARTGRAKVSLPGGCAIGARPVDLHIKVLQAMNADITMEAGYIVAMARRGLRGARFVFPAVSVGATANAIMAAVLAKGATILHNAAREPEIVDLAKCLTAMGAKISGAGTHKIFVEGVERLHAAVHKVLPDRIEAGSFACMASGCSDHIVLKGIDPQLLTVPLEVLGLMGIAVESKKDAIHIRGQNMVRAVDITTGVYPNFPTDLQPQFMALLAMAKGCCVIKETIFENRFLHAPELTRLGAHIILRGGTAIVEGVNGLRGTEVVATDLRAGMGLVIAALKAQGATTIYHAEHLDRGYTCLVEKLSKIGADVKRLTYA